MSSACIQAHFHADETHFYKTCRLCTQIRLESEVQGNSEMAYLYLKTEHINNKIEHFTDLVFFKSIRKTAVIGAGYIAVELAGILNALGSKVSSFIRYDRVCINVQLLVSFVKFNSYKKCFPYFNF